MKSTKKIICFAAMGLILAIVLAANIVAGVMSPVITTFFSGWGANLDSEEFKRSIAESDQLCEEIAGEGIVMLKNDNSALPLDSSVTNLNVFGWGATNAGWVVTGSGSGKSDGNNQKLLLESLTESGYSYNTALIDACVSFQGSRQGASLSSSDDVFYRLYEPSRSTYSSMMDAALAFSDTAVVVISRLGGEGKDLPMEQYRKTTGNNFTTDRTRTYLQLSSEEEDMIELVTTAGFEKVILLLNTCNAMELGFIEQYDIDSVLSVGALGQSGSRAIAKIFKGEILPSGKTVNAYAYNLKDDPTYVNAVKAGVTTYTNGGNYIDYAESIYVGYKYYETAAADGYINYNEVVQFPFGYGMTYTKFDWEVNSVSPSAGSTLAADGKIEIEVYVTNTGNEPGMDVVQAYYTPDYISGGIEKAHVNLAAFGKTALLQPGQTGVVKLTFDVYSMASYDCYDKNNNGFSGYELDGENCVISLRTDSHNVKKCDNATIEYKLPSSGIRYENDPLTDVRVQNLFTGASAYAGVAIDGSNSGAGIKYLSRADFAGTFPNAKAAARAKGFSVSPSWYDNNVITNTEPTQGVDSGLRLTVDGEDGKAMNDELVFELGNPENWECENWDKLLSQMSKNDLVNIVEQGGYRTCAIASIGKPECLDFDGPAGLNIGNSSISQATWTAFPVETVIASTWSSGLSYMFGLAVGKEAAESNVSGWYAPAVNIHRSPFGGRNFEYYSEDPVLSGVFGSETVRGAKTNGLYCYVKHFVANETETDRGGLHTWLTEQALRELYLKPFEMTVKTGGANAIMSSFNHLGAIWTGGNKALLTDILRNEWGFIGSVVTDYADGVSDNWMNLNQGLRAGNDLWLTGIYPAGIYMDIDSSASGVYTARAAAKNILYTYCNTYYIGKTTEPDDSRFSANVGLKLTDDVFPVWIFIIIGLDVVTLCGVGFWFYYIQLRKPKKKDENNNESNIV